MTPSGYEHELQLEARPCPACGSSDDTRVLAEATVDTRVLDDFSFSSRKLPEYTHHRLLECPSCQLLYASPAPSQSALAVAYEGADYASAEESRCAASTYARLVRDLLGALPSDAAVLDIGTGDGAFLDELIAADVRNVVGVEPSAAPIAAASPGTKGLIRKGLFRAADFEPDHFRLISSFQTLEHVPDPLELCRGAHRLLQDGGALLVVCHDRRARLNRLLGRRSPIYDVEHLQLFCPSSLRFLLATSGFSDIEVQPITNRYPLGYWLKLFPLPSSLKAKLLSAVDRSRLGRFPLSLPVGNLAVVGFKRSPSPA